MLNPKQCVLYSGGAAGTEQFFGALAEGWGIEEVNYSFEGHQSERKRGVRILTSEELALKDVSLTYVSKLMNREYTRAPLFRKVLQSICWQVSSGNQVIVIGAIQPDNTVKGGTGYTKCGGNYAASIKAGEMAEQQGFAQVLWLDGVEKKYVEEVGSMNIMFKIDGKIYTAPCTGTVLPGVTRRSIIELLKDWGYEVCEEHVAIADIMKAGHDGKLEEVFGTGTAAVVSPVKELDWKGDKVFISGGKIGELTQKLYDTLTGIQWGKLPDTRGWIVPVCKG